MTARNSFCTVAITGLAASTAAASALASAADGVARLAALPAACAWANELFAARNSDWWRCMIPASALRWLSVRLARSARALCTTGA